MATNDGQDFNTLNDHSQTPAGELVEGADGGHDARPANLGWTGWLISGSFHVIVLTMFGLIYWAVKEQEVDTPPVRVATIERPTEVEKTPVEQSLTPTTDQPLDVPEVADKPSPINNLDQPEADFSRETDIESDVPKGREEATADIETGGQAAFLAMGAGPGAAGAFGARTGGGKSRGLRKYGGTRASEQSVTSALEWFRKHQDLDGKWDPTGYAKNCAEDPKCEPCLLYTSDAADE